MTSSRDHHDNRGVFVELWVLDLVQNDYPAAILLSQLMWWAQPAKDGRPKLDYERDGQLWLVRPDGEWWDECRLSAKQVKTAKARLKAAGFIVTKLVHRGNAVVTAIRPHFEAIHEQADTGTEYARTGTNRDQSKDAPDRDESTGTDRDQSYLLTTTSELLPSEEKDGQATASPSSRPSPPRRARRVQQPAGLTPSTEPHVAAGATWTPKQRPPKAQDQRARDRAARAKAIGLAGRLMAEVVPALSPSVAALQVEVDQLLANGFTLDQIEAAARHPECCSWSYKALAFLAKKAAVPKAATGPDGFPLKPRPGPPPPPLIVAEPKQRLSAEELALVKQMNAERRLAKRVGAS